MLDDSSSFPINPTHLSESEKKKLVDIHQFIGPKLVFIKDIGGEQFGCDSASQIF